MSNTCDTFPLHVTFSIYKIKKNKKKKVKDNVSIVPFFS